MHTADPRAAELLSAGQAHAYGQVHGRAATRFRRADLGRQQADRATPPLRFALDNYRHAGRAATDAHRLANTIGENVNKLRDRASQLLGVLHRIEQAIKGPEKAIEGIVREVGIQAARLAVSALPRPLHLPVELAIRTVERVLDLGLGLGR